MDDEESKAMDVVNEILKDIPVRKLKSLQLRWDLITSYTSDDICMPILECEFYENEGEKSE